MTAPRELLAGLVDDAGLFPPTALPMDQAVERHRADVEAGEAMHTHRFLVPASRVDELRELLRDGEVFELGLIADRGGEGLAAVCADVATDPRLRLALLELPLAAFGDDEVIALEAALAELKDVPTEVPLYAEPVVQARPEPLLTALARHAGTRPLGAKLRCGGVRADLFPSSEQVAAFVTACVAAGVPFKATAGLHRAVRHTSPETGFTHHGYLNLLLATATAASGGQLSVQDVLETEKATELARRAHALSGEEAAAARRVLVSYGSCSTAAPVREARLLLDSAVKDH
ncbi:hypothetical protein DIZ27_04835 [Streptomyces sp. NWU339]|uniref:hypothetical protein n=1 Tax=Streptomyces sp. NWU339 TaxID=2185284 RepID=UPI000D672F3A|nr:hypothetical protein [Streptomyces sp. NWU339]PWI11386.1 hypothetical protein DIZ27_04835 [Streptomyces sp. NWU339]